jgi:vacuolar protein sorting-associated protein IST1
VQVEHVIREDFTIEAYEILSLLCDLLSERIRYLASEPQCPPDLYEAVCTLIWAAHRTDIAELLEVKKQLGKKYGKEFVEEAMENKNNCVNERVMHKLSVQVTNNSAARLHAIYS